MIGLKKRFLGTLCTALIFLMGGSAFAGEKNAADFSDVDQHWAKQAIINWAEDGLTSGYPDGTFRPNAQVSRAEFVALINRAFGLTKTGEIAYTDVSKSDWYAEDIAIAAQAGYISGYRDGSMKPESPINREEAAVILSRVLDLTDDPAQTLVFADNAKIASWSKGKVGAVSAGGHMGGYPDGDFAPAQMITRAESVTIMNRVAGAIYQTAGTFGPENTVQTVAGNVTVAASGITLQNMVINGDLNLSAGIGDGSINLKNVTVKGTTLVSGGGEHSFVLDEASILEQVVVERKGGRVRIAAQNGSIVRLVVAKSGAILEQTGGAGNAFGTVIVRALPGTVVDINGRVGILQLETAGITLNVAKDAVIGTMKVAAAASGAVIELAQGSVVNDMEINGAVHVTGLGAITLAAINVSGSTFAQAPLETVLADGTNSIIVGEDVAGAPRVDDTSKSNGGGNGGNRHAVQVLSLDLTFDGDQDLTAHKPDYSFMIPGEYEDTTLFTGFSITTDPAGGNIEITAMELDGYNWLNKPIAISPLAGGQVTTRDLLGSLDTGDIGVNLGSLRSFGDSLVLTGNVSKAGFSKTEVRVRIDLNGGGLDLTQVDNQWLEFAQSGTAITGTIKTGEEGTLLTDVTVLDFLFQSPIKINNKSYNTERKIKEGLAKIAGKSYDLITLGDLDGLAFSYQNGRRAYILTIEKSI